jgi:hypothetical protein
MNKLQQHISLITLSIIFSTFAVVVLAQDSIYQRCEPNSDCVIGEFIFADDGHTPVTSDNYCQIIITNPADSVIVNGANMSDKNDGWYYYTANIASPNGLYRATMCCDSGAARACEDKSFILGTSLDSVATKTDIAGIAASVWSYGSRTLNSFGTLVTDVWGAATRRLTDKNLAGGGNLATEAYIDTTKTDLLAAINDNKTLINNLNDISAADVWDYSSKSLNQPVDVSATSTLAVWNVAKSQLTSTGSIGKQVADNLDAAISSRSNLTAADVWSNATRTLTDYAANDTALAVWNNAQRTLSNYGNNISAGDIWNVLSSSLTGAGTVGNQLAANIDTSISSRAAQTSVDAIRSSQQKQWQIYISGENTVQTGNAYRAKLWILNYEAVPTDPLTLPTVTIYDPVRNTAVTAASMAKVSTGIYEYVFNVSSSAVQGTWETAAAVQVEAGKTITASNFWSVAGAPAQIKINSITSTTIPNISANITLTNEGSTSYEYSYEWCVVTSQDNACGGNNDTFYSSAAKLVQPGVNWNTDLAANVSTAGNYWFKVIVHFGTLQSGASQSFTAIKQAGGDSGGGGGGSSNNGSTGGQSGLLQNIAKSISAAGQAICNENTFPCNIIITILARLDAGDKRAADLENELAGLNASVKNLLNAAPRQIIIRQTAPKSVPASIPAPKRQKINIKLET